MLTPMLLGSALAAACGGGKKDAASCPAFSLTVDGKPVEGLTHKMAFTHKRGNERTHQVQLFNHDKVTCDELTSMKGRRVADGEVTVAAFTGGAGLMGSGVMVTPHTEFGLAIDLVSEAPAKVGDKVALCVAEKSFTPRVGDYADKAIKIAGLMEGTWCGMMDWDAK